jgi:hypothetical protein
MTTESARSWESKGREEGKKERIEKRAKLEGEEERKRI